MADENQKAATIMFDFICAMRMEQTTHAILERLSKVSRQFGFDSFAISGIPLPGENIDPYVLLNGWPSEWFDRYVAQRYVHVDPVIYQAKTSDDAFVWSEMLGGRRIGRSARRLMNEASEFRMLDGFSVPLHLRGGLQAIVTFGAETVDLTPEIQGVLQIIGIYAHNRVRALMDGAPSVTTVPKITMHERDVILWCAEGKTAWEIGRILGRSQKTVEHELQNAQRKLNCVNRAQLVAEAIRTGVIR